MHKPLVHEDCSIVCLQFGEDNLLWCGASSGELYLRDLNKDGVIARKWAAHKEGEYVICLYTDDDYVVTCPRGELSSIWRKSALMSNWCASPDCTIRTGITQSVQFDDEILVSAGNDGWLRMWKWHNKGHQGSDASLTLTSENKAHQGHIWKVAFDVTDDRLFTASEDCTVKMWDLQTLQLLKVLPHPDNVYRLYKEANTLITGGEDGDLRIYDTRAPDKPQILVAHGPTSVEAIQFNSVRLASAGQDAKIHLWDMRSLDRKLHTLSGHSLYIWDLQFDDEKIVSCSEDRTLGLWTPAV